MNGIEGHPFDWYPEPITDAEREVWAEHGEDGVRTLAQISQARRMLAEAKDLADIKVIRDMAKVARVLAETVGLSREAVNEAAEVQLRAERMAGDVLRQMEKAKGAATPQRDSHTESRPPRLRDLGITPKQSMNWQAAASLPEPVFEAHVQETISKGEPLTTSGVVQVARRIEREQRRAEPRPIVLPHQIPARIDVADARSLPLDDESVHLIVTSPPYGVDIGYADGDVPAGEWPTFMVDWLQEAYRVAAPSGRLALNVPLDTTRGGYRPTYAQAIAAALDAQWTYRTTIVWIDDQLGKSTARGSVDSASAPHIYAGAEMVALFSKGDWRREPTAAGDLEHPEWLEWTNGLWRFGGETRPWDEHPAPFPIRLPHQLIKLLSFPGDVVLDPFCGSGTTPAAAVQLRRQAVGFDASREYVISARARVADIARQVA